MSLDSPTTLGGTMGSNRERRHSSSSSSSVINVSDVNSHSFENSQNENENANCICCIPIWICSYLFCLRRKMSTYARKNVTWIWIIFGSLFAGLYLRCYVLRERTMSLSSSDIVRADGLFPLFCTNALVWSPTSDVTSYLLRENPQLNNSIVEYSFTKRFTMTDDNWEAWPVNLLTGSTISIELCTDGFLNVFLISGTKNFEKWQAKKNYDVYLHQYSIYSKCIPIELKNLPTDRYYFVLKNYEGRTKIRAKILLKRTTYKIYGNRVLSRKVGKQYNVNLDIWTSESLLLQLNSTKWKNVSVTVFCSPRNYIFVIFFLFLPFIFGLILCFLLDMIFGKDPELSHHDSESSLIHNGRPSTASIIVISSPPSYDSIFPRNDPNTLPSYQECVGIRPNKPN